MYLSVIRVGWWSEYEMLIPKVIGKVLTGFSIMRRLNRLLPVGHRIRGYEVVEV